MCLFWLVVWLLMMQYSTDSFVSGRRNSSHRFPSLVLVVDSRVRARDREDRLGVGMRMGNELRVHLPKLGAGAGGIGMMLMDPVVRRGMLVERCGRSG
jgi:hypothetical protein